MAIDKLALYNGILRCLGDRRLATLDDDVPARHLLDGIWDDDFVKDCLEAGPWVFATRTVKLEADVTNDAADDFGFTYGFDKPDDWVLTAMISGDEDFRRPLQDFADEQAYIFAYLDVIYLKYVSDDASYGRDYSLWPQSFFRYVCAAGAALIAERLTGSTSTADRMEALSEKRKNQALGKNGNNMPTRFMPQGGWNDARQGRNAQYDKRRR